ncbi:aspartic-type endopeptidase OPSB [Fusarium pseudoanthophilum]|uniref:Aspartic-type endopeptidase OPSB n=1 Tax=Fusarium pseudoanthophilum TaxID=48495 RepID=A0A8H5NNK6_9HYPO|nr:aspartic-type endopeptidase OPSB [Fusarium pseudoanthophilum]
MKGSSLVLSSTLLSCAHALQLYKRHNPSVVSVNFEKRTKDALPSHDKRDNDAIVEMNVDRQGSSLLYWANFTIGNPPQKLSAEIDTGSAELLVLTNHVESCKEQNCQGGIFNPEKSGSFEWGDEQVSNSFGNQSPSTLSNFVFGVGIDSLENANTKYPNLPYALADAGEINTPAFSLWLNNETHGEFLFGGVNKAKYTGSSDLTLNIPLANFLGETPVKSGVDGVEYCKIVYYEASTSIILADDILRGAYVIYDWGNMEISLAQYNSEEAEDDIHEILRDVPGVSFATDVPTMYLKFDQPAETEGPEIPTELPTITATPLSTATGSGTGSAAASWTAAEAGDDKDNGAMGSLPGNLMYMMMLAFIFDIVLLEK